MGSWEETSNDIRVRVLGDVFYMVDSVAGGDQWQQVKELINQKWTELDAKDIKKMVRWMKKDSTYGKRVPAGWTVPKPDQYIEMVSGLYESDSVDLSFSEEFD